MANYDFRCDNCGNRFTLFYKSIKDYDAASPACPECGQQAISRIIGSITAKAPAHDFTGMSSGQMLSVLESGDSKQVGQMFDQIGGSDPRLGKEYHDATQQLLKGESMDTVEKNLQASSKNPGT